MAISGILFDFNGTMALDSAVNTQSWAAFIEETWGHRLSDQELGSAVLGNGNRAILTFFGDSGLSEAEYTRLSERKEVLYRDLSRERQLRLIDGLAQLLDDIAAKGYPRNMATASIRANVEFYFSHYGLDRWFDLTKVAYDDGVTQLKPHPEMYEKAAARIGVSPADCLVFEDSPSGIAAAVRAGIPHIIAINKDGHLKDAPPQVKQVIRDYTEFDRSILGK